MYKCPECNNSMSWQSDVDDDLSEEESFLSFYSCNDCEIELTKRTKVG